MRTTKSRLVLVDATGETAAFGAGVSRCDRAHESVVPASRVLASGSIAKPPSPMSQSAVLST
jgi:hypothetical protein